MKISSFYTPFLTSMAFIFAACGEAPKQTQNEQPDTTADMIVTNAKVAVMDANNTFTEAIAVKDGLVLSTGSAEELLKLKGEETQVIDAKGSAWISQEEEVKGTLENGMFADFALLSDDYFTVGEEQINDLESVLTVVGGNIVYGAEDFESFTPELPAIIPDWSPVKFFGGYQD